MEIIDKLKLAFYEKNGNEFEKFVVSIYKLQFPDLLAVKPQGQKGDGANDGYISGKLVVQVYSPEQVEANKTIEKMLHDFERAKNYGWNFNEWNFVVNDKFNNLHNDIHKALDKLKKNNPSFIIKLIDAETLKDKIISQLNENKLRVYIILNTDKDISEFGDFEKVEKVIDALSKEKSIRKIQAVEFKNFSFEEFLPNGVEKLEINIKDEDLSKFFGMHIEKSKEVMEEYIPQIGLDLFVDIGKYIQDIYKKFEEKMKPEYALLKTYNIIYNKLDDDANLQTALWVIMAYFFDICDIGKIK